MFKCEVDEGNCKAPEWKGLSSKDLGISNSSISKPSRVVLDRLKKEGFEVYLVGGCVRDLILKRTPKDFDIITSAELKEASICHVRSVFSLCHIIGRRFPICHVHVDDTIVEVSSFSTCATNQDSDLGFAYESPVDCDEKDYMRWRNCLQRDFTINGLMFDPYANLVYDYMGGLEDIKQAKVRTMICAMDSFQQDCARILRAIRIGARLGFSFTHQTGHSITYLASSVLRLDKVRILMEMNYMLAYGSAEASLRLLWRYRVLEILLPIQAAYFVQQGFRRWDKRSNMLLSLFSTMDNLLAPDRPCHCSLWVGILAFHKALSDQPRDPLVVAAFCLAVHNGGDISEALNIARSISTPHDISFHELLQPQNLEVESLRDAVMNLAASVKNILTNMTDEYFVSKAISMTSLYPTAPYSDLVFISLDLYLRVCKMFECARLGKEKGFVAKQGSKIDYDLLALGSLQEVRHVFARVVFDTVFPLHLSQDHRPS
ncbi:hypothetical protein RHMOL_Rhmol12G0213000 [Rhododendron molle]|uniref:Uncharacterized protein n=1 Tax=Rhododendron molle TaxID=49168 RepID=A0ACC0LLS4_RHOML|nr:hypothetical protein RHMOL_Rhmol12G0213000 [Rhododendron molle]